MTEDRKTYYDEPRMLYDAAREIGRQSGLTFEEIAGAVLDAQREKIEKKKKEPKRRGLPDRDGTTLEELDLRTAYMTGVLAGANMVREELMKLLVREKAAERGLTADEMLEQLLQQGIENVGYQEA